MGLFLGYFLSLTLKLAIVWLLIKKKKTQQLGWASALLLIFQTDLEQFRLLSPTVSFYILDHGLEFY